MINKKIIGGTVILAAILLPVIVWGNQDVLFVSIVRIVFGSVFILFLPGYFLTVNFFSSTEIDRLERFALSFALSISVVPLLTFYFNLIGLGISAVSVYAVVCGTILLNILYYYLAPRFIKSIKKNHVKSA